MSPTRPVCLRICSRKLVANFRAALELATTGSTGACAAPARTVGSDSRREATQWVLSRKASPKQASAHPLTPPTVLAATYAGNGTATGAASRE